MVQTSKNFILPFEGLGDTVCIKSCSDPKINLIKIILGDFVQAMYRASTKEQVASASLLMLQRIDMWINQLIEYTRTCPGYNRKDRRQAELTCKHRSSNLSYTTILDRFAKEPSMPTLVEVRKALKELYPLKNIDSY